MIKKEEKASMVLAIYDVVPFRLKRDQTLLVYGSIQFEKGLRGLFWAEVMITCRNYKEG